MTGTVAERIDKVLTKCNVPPRARICAANAIIDEVIRTVDEQADATMMIAVLALHQAFGFGQERLSKFSDEVNALISEGYANYGLDTIIALKRKLKEEGIEYTIMKGTRENEGKSKKL